MCSYYREKCPSMMLDRAIDQYVKKDERSSTSLRILRLLKQYEFMYEYVRTRASLLCDWLTSRAQSRNRKKVSSNSRLVMYKGVAIPDHGYYSAGDFFSSPLFHVGWFGAKSHLAFS